MLLPHAPRLTKLFPMRRRTAPQKRRPCRAAICEVLRHSLQLPPHRSWRVQSERSHPIRRRADFPPFAGARLIAEFATSSLPCSSRRRAMPGRGVQSHAACKYAVSASAKYSQSTKFSNPVKGFSIAACGAGSENLACAAPLLALHPTTCHVVAESQRGATGTLLGKATFPIARRTRVRAAVIFAPAASRRTPGGIRSNCSTQRPRPPVKLRPSSQRSSLRRAV